MIADIDMEEVNLVLAAEDFPDAEFESNHFFTAHDQRCIARLRAHGPVLLKGARGSGKSALMIEAVSKMYPKNSQSNAIGIYLSLRHLGLLRSQGRKYEELLCKLITSSVNKTLGEGTIEGEINEISILQDILSEIASQQGKRIVLMFDDAAHIGREASLNDFFDIFRTLSNSIISCKASIYPGVTKFGTRFDVYNDATVIDLTRNEQSDDFCKTFMEIIDKRFNRLFRKISASSDIGAEKLTIFLARSVLGNMRSFLFACQALTEQSQHSNKITITNISEAYKNLASNYYWPLIEEIEPKLGAYQPMVGISLKIAETLFSKAADKQQRTVIILREINQNLLKPLEILEYTGFISRREVSRSMKSRGRGTRYALNICNLAENLDGSRITLSLLEDWISNNDDSVEFHRGSELNSITLPEMNLDADLDILNRPIDKLSKSKAYPYGITPSKLDILKENNINTVEDLAQATDEQLLALEGLGDRTLNRLRSVIHQAIWM
ncbi:helix-hairpin-helix domain-containing protein [Lelliottia amnigena]|uniref:helix-hairpin-helix domain-containing protein n=1 Tax=Lelliottia amnigena TaxID=61646 RepID=UPI00195EDFCE|nr:helix-hairpin-helix domain-containing protein [Lelliottia amnigena]MBM7355458.1 hypothetical protein [Lelliottia amnigena]WSO17804.1 helix-hairpin-helix domain-containing protein [Lelliottia amnigena]